MTIGKLQKEIYIVVTAITITTITALAVPLPEPNFADAGACTNVVLPALSNSGVLSFSLSFVPGVSNNVEVAFGADADGDGILSPPERRMMAGWDRDAWFMRCADGEVVMQPVQPSNGITRDFRWALRLRSGRIPSRLSATVDGAAVFSEIASVPPGWLYEPDWNMACVIVRGADVGGDMSEVKVTIDGTVLELR